MNFLISDTFTDSLARLTGDEYDYRSHHFSTDEWGMICDVAALVRAWSPTSGA